MDVRRAGLMTSSAFLVGVLGVAVAAPVAAADCALSAPAYANVGTPLTVTGSGFPASASVDITITIAGGSPDRFSIQSDATGAFQIVSTPEALDLGATTVEAAAGSACTAQVSYTVLAADATPPTTNEPSDDSGSSAGTGAAPGAPSTDAAIRDTTGGSPGTWTLALLLLAVGAGSLFFTKAPRRR